MRSIYLSSLCFFLAGVAWAQSAQPSLIDEFENVNCEAYLARMDNVTVQAANHPTASIHVVVYEGRHARRKYSGESTTEWVLPEYGLAKAKIRSMKKYLASRGANLKRISFLPVRFREHMSVEIWMVPQGASPPTPTPTLERMKYRKGKPDGFCMDSGA